MMWVRILAPRDNLFVVGDDQSVYGFRGGKAGNHEGIYEGGLSKGQTDPSGCQLSQQRVYIVKGGSACDRK